MTTNRKQTYILFWPYNRLVTATSIDKHDKVFFVKAFVDTSGPKRRLKMLVVRRKTNMTISVVRHNFKLSIQKLGQKLNYNFDHDHK